MIRKVFSLLPVVLMYLGVAKAQLPCTTVEANDTYKKAYPQIEQYEKQLNQFIAEGMNSMNLDRARAKGTEFGPDDLLHIPVVVHVIHDYGSVDYVSDNDVFKLIDQINEIYLKHNSDTADVIAPFKSYIGNPKVMFHLATKDPQGRPTTGITHRRSYLTNGGDDQAKFDQWDPSSYLNIWTIAKIGRGISNGVVAAYAVFPSSAAAFPYPDGIITSAGSMLKNKTIPHEIGHILGLYHTWGNIAVATNCTGDDEVDDTPPTTGHFSNGDPYGATASGSCNNASLYDTSCTNNVTSLSKIKIDPLATPVVDNGNKGIDYLPRTNLSIQSVKIYPASIGQEFEITHYKQNSSGVFNVTDVYKTKTGTVGIDMLGSANIVTNYTAKDRSSITFTASKHLWIDSFNVYPNTIGDSIVVLLTKQNGDTLKMFKGKTTTNTGAQVIPFSAFVPNAAGYVLQVVKNPGLKSDTLVKSTLDSINSNSANQLKKFRTIDGAISFTEFVDTTNQDQGTNATSYKGRYNYLYNWSVRYDALTTTDSGEQVVTLGYKVIPDTTYRLTVTKNPGLKNDAVGGAPYVKNIPCIIDVRNDTSDGRYNLLYELTIRYGYIKNCIDYPDTVNTQNIMDYADCPKMFTKQQVQRMRATLASNVGNRNKLVSDTTHVRTGILDKIGGTYGVKNDLKPIPDVSVERASSLGQDRSYFLCASSKFAFKQRSWRDTISSVEWTFSNNATNPTINQTNLGLTTEVNNSFGDPGWVDVTLKATGNNTGDSTIEFKSLVYAADEVNKINPLDGYFMEFDQNDANNSVEKWPIFNYYNNENKWHLDKNAGYYDNTCITYSGYDKRAFPAYYVGTPKGDFDDFFTPAFDLSGMTSTECRLNFLSSGAFRVSDSRLMKDTLEISYSLDCGQNWQKLATLTKGDIANKGYVAIEYAPLYFGDWDLKSYDIPMSARKDKVFFRFRYHPGVDDINNSASLTLPGTGNNFYIDRINISPYKLGVNTLLNDTRNIALAPNPTNGSSQLVIRSSSREMAQVLVTDVTGKVVYTTQHQLNGDINTIEIPASAIKVKGVYMVHLSAGNMNYTEKLVSF
ncbi:MAG: T9SS type A sorting domain-containing protein [Chitinophagales bacterium]|nr:T9SS type A sorting domain-containing protein [Chitinophagales bacterium]